ncbi:MAG: hypothetical protein Q4P30_03305 [Eubacteriales bacterium]|nr:hypothetical protein [Eubacteriales bacterium]
MDEPVNAQVFVLPETTADPSVYYLNKIRGCGIIYAGIERIKEAAWRIKI